MVHFYYAQLLNQIGNEAGDRQLDTMRAELKKTVAASPNFLPAVDLLAYVNLSRNADFEESATILRSALAVAPDRDDLTMRLAEVLYRMRELNEAQSLLQRVSSSSSANPALKQRAASLLQTVTRTAQRGNPQPAPPVLSVGRDEPISSGADEQVAPAATESSQLPRIARRDPDPAQPAPDPAAVALRQIDPTTGKPQVARGSTEGEVLLGTLKSLDCSANGVTLTVETDHGIVKLHSDKPETMQIVSFTTAVKGGVQCGTMPGSGLRVRINYKPDASGRTLGAPLLVAFLDDSK
jgi:hypothetical protein